MAATGVVFKKTLKLEKKLKFSIFPKQKNIEQNSKTIYFSEDTGDPPGFSIVF